jgi:hypothetical protein
MQRWRWYCCLPDVAVPLARAERGGVGWGGAHAVAVCSALDLDLWSTLHAPASCCVCPQLQWPVALQHDDIRNEQRMRQSDG